MLGRSYKNALTRSFIDGGVRYWYRKVRIPTFPYSDAFMAGIRTQDVLIQSIFAPSNHDEKHISRI